MKAGDPIGLPLLVAIMLGLVVLPGWTLFSRLVGDAHLAATVEAAQSVRAPLTAVHPAQEPDAWGEPVDGVQLKLAISKNKAPRLPGELPPLETQIRNQGSDTVTFVGEAIVYPNIEIDGVWYSQAWGGSCCSHVTEIAPGAQSDALPLYIVQAHLFELNARPARGPDLRPGNHSLRVRSVSSDLYSIQSSAHRRMVLVSNAIAIDIPDLTSAVEQQALIEQASAGGVNSLPAAQRLVQKYPDAALGAIQTAILATPQSVTRSEYVDLAAKLPGDAPVTFLKSQLLPNVELLSRVRAAAALLTRGDADGLRPMIEAWQDIQLRMPTNISELNAEGNLITFLATSGHAEAIDALGRDMQAPVDVRLAVVQTFLPPPVNRSSRMTSSTGQSLVGAFTVDMPNLPGGPVGNAIERLLSAALEDKGQRVGLKATYDAVSYADPRVCDIAAFVISRRWPQQYRFSWPASLAERDAQIAVIRNTWRQR